MKRETIVGKPVFMLKIFSKYLIDFCVEQRVSIGRGQHSCLTTRSYRVFDSLTGQSTSVHQVELDGHQIHEEAGTDTFGREHGLGCSTGAASW